MSAHQESESFVLPPGTRALYIGPPKSGTTALQAAASAARDELYTHGVVYPGSGESHHREIYAFMGRRDRRGKSTRGRMTRQDIGRAPAPGEWAALMDEIRAEPSRRVLISHESAARATRRMARRFVDELGADRIHIIITLRPPADVLPSRWSELVKEGMTDTFDGWLRRLYLGQGRRLARGTRRYLNQAGLVRRWAAVAGPENVTVIVVDGRDKNFLSDVFEQLLDLPARTLARAGTGNSNRSMTVEEAEIVRRLNTRLERFRGTRWFRYIDAFRTSALNRALVYRTPAPGESRLRLPSWAVEFAARDGRRYARRIRTSGVRVIGNLRALRTHRQRQTRNESRTQLEAPAQPEVPTQPTAQTSGVPASRLALELVWGAIRGGVDYARGALRIKWTQVTWIRRAVRGPRQIRARRLDSDRLN